MLGSESLGFYRLPLTVPSDEEDSVCRMTLCKLPKQKWGEQPKWEIGAYILTRLCELELWVSLAPWLYKKNKKQKVEGAEATWPREKKRLCTLGSWRENTEQSSVFGVGTRRKSHSSSDSPWAFCLYGKLTSQIVQDGLDFEQANNTLTCRNVLRFMVLLFLQQRQVVKGLAKSDLFFKSSFPHNFV